jgi:hypothetical protein
VTPLLPSGMAADTTSDPRDRPVLAPSTWLVGQLQESALENPPWAVEQAKRGYIEMSELAYRVAEQANGDQTIDEIATAVSTALRRPVSAVDVEALIDTVLIPRGVVRDSNGQAHQDDPDAADADDPSSAPSARDGRGRARRPSADRAGRRERVVGPGWLEAVASILMWLFWSPVMLVLVVASLAGLIWLYGLHGLAQSVIQVLVVPVLLPIALVVAVLAGAVAGIGPMVALYSSGATIQRLRIVPSWRHPRFEVDVADDYGLSRWARLIVSVSGIYFQLVLALALCVLALATGAELLLLSVALLTLEMLRRLLPFGRGHGDRLLADLLLVPEPLRYAEQAFERFVPGPHPPAWPLPPLKRWGRVAIGMYLLAVAIVLLSVGLVILQTTPTIVATVVAALLAYLSSMLAAIGERDVVGFVGSLLNAAILVLVSFGLVVALIAFVGGLLARAWTWCQLTPRRRLLGSLGAMLMAVVLALFWVPVRGLGADEPPRSLAGGTFRPLTAMSRGTLYDLFGETPTVETSRVETSDVQPGHPPIVTTDIGSGGVGGPPPGQSTSPASGGPGSGGTGGGSTAGGATTGNSGSASIRPTPGTSAGRAAPIGAGTPGPAGARRGAQGSASTTAGSASASRNPSSGGPQTGNESNGSAAGGSTTAAGGAQVGNVSPGAPAAGSAAAGQSTTAPGAGPAGQTRIGPSAPSASNAVTGNVPGGLSTASSGNAPAGGAQAGNASTNGASAGQPATSTNRASSGRSPASARPGARPARMPGPVPARRRIRRPAPRTGSHPVRRPVRPASRQAASWCSP